MSGRSIWQETESSKGVSRRLSLFWLLFSREPRVNLYYLFQDLPCRLLRRKWYFLAYILEDSWDVLHTRRTW